MPENDPLLAASAETKNSFFPTAVIQAVVNFVVVVVSRAFHDVGSAVGRAQAVVADAVDTAVAPVFVQLDRAFFRIATYHITAVG